MTNEPESIYTQTPPDWGMLGYWMRQAADDYPPDDGRITQAAIAASWQVTDRGADAAPAIIAEAWRKMVEAIDEYRRDHCSNCRGDGTIQDYEDAWPCQACAPFAAEMD